MGCRCYKPGLMEVVYRSARWGFDGVVVRLRCFSGEVNGWSVGVDGKD